MIKSLALSVIAVSLVGCQSQATKPLTPPLNDQAIIEAYSGNSFIWNQKGLNGPVKFNADNTSSITYNGKSSEGTWSTKNNMLCLSWTQFRKGVERCDTIYNMGDGKYDHYRDGKFNSRFTKN